jgi:hypothetical protein
MRLFGVALSLLIGSYVPKKIFMGGNRDLQSKRFPCVSQLLQDPINLNAEISRCIPLKAHLRQEESLELRLAGGQTFQ